MRTSRRELLAGLAGVAVTGSDGVVGSSSRDAGRTDGRQASASTPDDWRTDAGPMGDRRTDAVRRTQPEEFDPAVHGFGFRNWSTREAVFAEHDHSEVDEEEVRQLLGRRWATPARRSLGVDVLQLPNRLLEAIAKQVYVSVNQLSGTNGHCFGMVYAAQQYFENPASVPLGREVASEFGHPEAPVGEPDSGPVARAIDRYHLTQYLDLHAWLGRRAMIHPAWIDYRRQLDRVTSVVDEFGTAGLTVFDTSSRASHQVLVYDYRRESDATRLFVYDPNYPAGQYARTAEPPAIVVDTAGSRATVRPYANGYDGFVFNRKDRVVAARSASGPDVLVGPGDGRLREEVFDLALFLVDSRDVSLRVVGPDDRPLRRDTATYLDRAQSKYARMRYRYGFSPGKYTVRVVGESDAEYALRALVADADGTRLDASRPTSIRAGEVHRYVAEVPDSGTGSLERASGGTSWPGALGAVGLGAGVAGVAAGAYARLRGRGKESEGSARSE